MRMMGKKNVLLRTVAKDTAEVRDLYPSSLELYFEDHPLLPAWLAHNNPLVHTNSAPRRKTLPTNKLGGRYPMRRVRSICTEYRKDTAPRIPSRVLLRGPGDEKNGHSLSEYSVCKNGMDVSHTPPSSANQLN